MKIGDMCISIQLRVKIKRDADMDNAGNAKTEQIFY